MKAQKIAKQELGEVLLIERARWGDRKAFEELMLLYQDQILSLVLRQVGNEQVARELAQDTFVRAFFNLQDFRGESRFSTWLIRIALNVTNTYFSSRRYQEQLNTVPFDAKTHDTADTQNEALQAGEDHRQLSLHIGSLPVPLREVLVMVALEDKTHCEAAEILNIPAGTVSARMSKALTMLRKKIERRK